MFSKLFVILHYKTNNVNETADGYSAFEFIFCKRVYNRTQNLKLSMN